MSNVTSIQDIKTPEVDPEEFAAAETEAEKVASNLNGQIDTFTYTFNKPFEYNGKSYNKLSFDFGKLEGQDCLDIEDELQTRNIAVIAPEFNTRYHLTFAAKACEEPIGSDAFGLMPAKAFLKITRAARNFLLKME